jgi:hypothetical protein
LELEVTISYGDKKHHLGSFDTKQQAALAYDRASGERQRSARWGNR